ncbi:hypothetical protein chiPu_0022943 [Chiloscyllium punctatum]|uniref:Uncharacterized protein n=1 Tax=Chiloscyllium punctatum TaxID=137246 RepID=A0A401T9M4_CHIPU|nr:hypothetical protein [Chiloscyllium punctatum]
MPVRRGHVAPQNTYLDTIIRRFELQSEYLSLSRGMEGHSGELGGRLRGAGIQLLGWCRQFCGRVGGEREPAPG